MNISSEQVSIHTAGMYQPQSLTTYARRVINQRLGRWNYSWSLPIPNTLKHELRDAFLEDNIVNVNWTPDTDCYKILNWYSFTTPFVNVSPDIFLAIQLWTPERYILTFIPEITFVSYYWYERKYHARSLNEPRLCQSCAFDQDYSCQMFKTFETMHGNNVMDEVFQVIRNWCSMCHTTTLFKIMEYPFPGCRRKFIEELDNTDSE